jgi:hypothetical protein
MNAYEMRRYLGRLTAERHAASAVRLGDNAVYLRDLEDDLVAARHAFVGLAVTEIATLRGQLSGPQAG